eukprot:5160694-Amphidinium_carterae.1
MRGAKALAAVRNQLRSSRAHAQAKLRLFMSAVGTAALYATAHIVWTQALLQRLGSWHWGALRSALRLRRRPLETWLAWHLRTIRRVRYLTALHRQHNLLVQALLRQHRWAGHVARSPSTHLPSLALKAFGLRWWRTQQALNLDQPRHLQLRHPGRFRSRRWESIISMPGDTDTWIDDAADRHHWKCRAEIWLQSKSVQAGRQFQLHYSLTIAMSA